MTIVTALALFVSLLTRGALQCVPQEADNYCQVRDSKLFGLAILDCRDANENNWSDLVVANPLECSGGTDLWLIDGGTANPMWYRTTQFVPPYIAMTECSDRNRDGFSDLLVCGQLEGRLAIGVFSLTSGQQLSMVDTGQSIGPNARLLLDMAHCHNSKEMLVIGMPSAADGRGWVGSFSQEGTTASDVLPIPDGVTSFGSSVEVLADWDGDLCEEVLVAAETEEGAALYIYPETDKPAVLVINHDALRDSSGISVRLKSRHATISRSGQRIYAVAALGPGEAIVAIDIKAAARGTPADGSWKILGASLWPIDSEFRVEAILETDDYDSDGYHDLVLGMPGGSGGGTLMALSSVNGNCLGTRDFGMFECEPIGRQLARVHAPGAAESMLVASSVSMTANRPGYLLVGPSKLNGDDSGWRGVARYSLRDASKGVLWKALDK